MTPAKDVPLSLLFMQFAKDNQDRLLIRKFDTNNAFEGSFAYVEYGAYLSSLEANRRKIKELEAILEARGV